VGVENLFTGCTQRRSLNERAEHEQVSPNREASVFIGTQERGAQMKFNTLALSPFLSIYSAGAAARRKAAPLLMSVCGSFCSWRRACVLLLLYCRRPGKQPEKLLHHLSFPNGCALQFDLRAYATHQLSIHNVPDTICSFVNFAPVRI
jgi:hypothetical protein